MRPEKGAATDTFLNVPSDFHLLAKTSWRTSNAKDWWGPLGVHAMRARCSVMRISVSVMLCSIYSRGYGAPRLLPSLRFRRAALFHMDGSALADYDFGWCKRAADRVVGC